MKKIAPRSLQPGDTIGILGGGQLGRMLAIAAARMGLRTIVLEPGENCPAAQTCNRHIIADYDDTAALNELAESCDVITYEFENIPNSAVRFLEDKIPLLPNARALEKSQDRLTEKKFLNEIGIATAPFAEINALGDLVRETGKPEFAGILKTRRLGYDGKGQAKLSEKDSEATLAKAWQAIGQVPCVLEAFITFDKEISVIAARGTNGEIACFDPAQNVHRNGILDTSSVPAEISANTTRQAQMITAAILNGLDYIGVMGVEFFVLSSGELLVNEIAPRVHNSGHWTEIACTVSQFEQHIRAISGWPLGNTGRHSDCVMENLIGDDIARLPALLSEPNVHLHLYGKADVKRGRKMGHFTRLTSPKK